MATIKGPLLSSEMGRSSPREIDDVVSTEVVCDRAVRILHGFALKRACGPDLPSRRQGHGNRVAPEVSIELVVRVEGISIPGAVLPDPELREPLSRHHKVPVIRPTRAGKDARELRREVQLHGHRLTKRQRLWQNRPHERRVIVDGLKLQQRPVN